MEVHKRLAGQKNMGRIAKKILEMIPLDKLNDFASSFESVFLLERTFEETAIVNTLIAETETATTAEERYK